MLHCVLELTLQVQRMCFAQTITPTSTQAQLAQWGYSFMCIYFMQHTCTKLACKSTNSNTHTRHRMAMVKGLTHQSGANVGCTNIYATINTCLKPRSFCIGRLRGQNSQKLHLLCRMPHTNHYATHTPANAPLHYLNGITPQDRTPERTKQHQSAYVGYTKQLRHH